MSLKGPISWIYVWTNSEDTVFKEVMQKQYELLARSSAGVESNKLPCQLEFMQVSLKKKKKKKAFMVLVPDDGFSPLTLPCLSFSPFRKKALGGRPFMFLLCIFASPLLDCLPGRMQLPRIAVQK